MAKKVLILSGSPRKGGNSDLLCREFARGAQESGCDVEILRVAGEEDCALLGVLLLPDAQRRMRP